MICPRLIAITDAKLAPVSALLERAERLAAAAAPGSVLVQLRDNELCARERFAFGQALSSAVRRHGQLFAVNDRLDLAELLHADALHLGEQGVSTADVRSLLRRVWISRACHDPERVPDMDADALLLSPVFAPRKGAPALGLTGLERALILAKRSKRPNSSRPELGIYALGGVTVEHAAACLAAGAAGIAAVGAVFAEGEPESLVPSLVSALGIRR